MNLMVQITIPLTLTHDGSTKQASDVGDATMTWTINGSGTATIMHQVMISK